MTLSKIVHIKLMATLNQNDLMGRRHDYCWRYSGGRTESTRELTDQEALAIVNDLNNQANKVRQKMIAIAGKMNWAKNTTGLLKALDDFCQKYGMYKKPLMKHSIAELAKILTILENEVYASYLKGLNR